MEPNDEPNEPWDLLPGPIENTVLYAQEKHITTKIWRDGGYECITTRNSCSCPTVVHPLAIPYLQMSGFYGLHCIGYFQQDIPLLMAFVERYRPETHTFHLPHGEMTVTLQDVEVLLGLPIEGLPITDKNVMKSEWPAIVERLLGVKPEEHYFDKGGLSMNWIAVVVCYSENSIDQMDLEDDRRVQCYTRGLIMLLLGGQYLAGPTGTHVKLRYLLFLEDLQACKSYSWGSAILACMYRELSKAALGAKRIAGALTLFTLWAWTRVPSVCPVDLNSLPSSGDLPYGFSLANAVRVYNPHVVAHNLKFFADRLSLLQENEICWEPYSHFLQVSNSTWRARVPLILFEIVEHHYPDRVARQFAYKQNVPDPCFPDHFDLHKIDLKGKSRTSWDKEHSAYIHLWNNRRFLCMKGNCTWDNNRSVMIIWVGTINIPDDLFADLLLLIPMLEDFRLSLL